MDSNKYFLPNRLSHSNYWLKNYLVTHVANVKTLLINISTSYNALFAIETTEVELFGSLLYHHVNIITDILDKDLIQFFRK